MLFSAFILGILGSFHCIGMCGPIAFLLPLDRESNYRKFMQIFLYHSGRIFSYAVIGFVFGLLGKSFSLFGLQQYLSVGIGFLMLLLVIIPKKKMGRLNPETMGFKIFRDLKNYLGKELKKKNADTYFTVGFLNGFLPCGLVYMAVLGAIAGGEALLGSIYMIIFGLGTIPLMTGAIWLSSVVSFKRKKNIQKFTPVFVAILAVFFIVRGLGLDIPYLSPSQPSQTVSSRMECIDPNIIKAP